jgi:acyl dehydratase
MKANMIDRKHIGYAFLPFTSVIEAGRVRLYCEAIGETDPIHLDATTARNAGYRDILAPLTFPTAVSMDSPNPRRAIELLDIDLARVLHGEEQYDYFAPICVGDEITSASKIVDIYDKKGGSLEFVILELNMRNQLDERVCRIRRTFIVRRIQDGLEERSA